MSRHKGSKNRTDKEVSKENLTNELKKYLHDDDINEVIVDEIISDNGKSDKDEKPVSIYEASQELGVSESTIRIWVDHGHLTSINGRIPVRSIRECRFNTGRFV